MLHGDELWFFYTGIKYRDTPPNPDPKRGAICLAVLRPDGFISLDAGTDPGTLLTRPLVVAGEKLFVNIDAAKGGLEVTALDGAGRTVAVSEPIIGDKLRAEVQWKSGDLAKHKGTPRPSSFYASSRTVLFILVRRQIAMTTAIPAAMD